MARNDKIMVRVTKDEKDMIQKYADSMFMNTATLVRHLVLKAIKESK